MFLSNAQFKEVIRNTPLISIDLIIENQAGSILLGLRKNRPAQGYWFVPGGRINKNETIEVAFERITFNELGVSYSTQNSEFLGAYTHIYDDNVFGEGFGTHYVVLAYRLNVNQDDLPLTSCEQHSHYQWLEPESILKSPNVHVHTKWYFQ